MIRREPWAKWPKHLLFLIDYPRPARSAPLGGRPQSRAIARTRLHRIELNDALEDDDLTFCFVSSSRDYTNCHDYFFPPIDRLAGHLMTSASLLAVAAAAAAGCSWRGSPSRLDAAGSHKRAPLPKR